MQITINTLYKQGYSKTEIAKMSSVDRKTVRKYNSGVRLFLQLSPVRLAVPTDESI